LAFLDLINILQGESCLVGLHTGEATAQQVAIAACQ
jgi:hypothetical protein